MRKIFGGVKTSGFQVLGGCAIACRYGIVCRQLVSSVLIVSSAGGMTGSLDLVPSGTLDEAEGRNGEYFIRFLGSRDGTFRVK